MRHCRLSKAIIDNWRSFEWLRNLRANHGSVAELVVRNLICIVDCPEAGFAGCVKVNSSFTGYEESTRRAKAHFILLAFSARLKSGPVTKLSEEAFFAA